MLQPGQVLRNEKFAFSSVRKLDLKPTKDEGGDGHVRAIEPNVAGCIKVT